MKSFAETYPELVKEWSKENKLSPNEVSYGSNKMIMWEGSCGHRWIASAKNRGHGHGCPYCTGNKVQEGLNDLATLYPRIAKEWSARNYPLEPSEVTAKANRIVWWECSKCRQEWQARIADRTDGHGCPVCSGEKLVTGINDFATEHPDLATEWSEKNEQQPTHARSKSRKKVWWKCNRCGHEWQAVINSRVKGSICPECIRRDRMERYPYHNAEEEKTFKTAVIAYYAVKADEGIILESDDKIGVMLDTFFPRCNAAIIYSRPLVRECLVRRENAKNWLCLNAGIKLFRISEPGANEYDNCICLTMKNKSYEVLSLAVQTAFDMLGIDADIDIERDMREIISFSKSI